MGGRAATAPSVALHASVRGDLAHEPMRGLIEIIRHLHREDAAALEPRGQCRHQHVVPRKPLEHGVGKNDVERLPAPASAGSIRQYRRGRSGCRAIAAAPPRACPRNCRGRATQRRGSARPVRRLNCPARIPDRSARAPGRAWRAAQTTNPSRDGSALPRTGRIAAPTNSSAPSHENRPPTNRGRGDVAPTATSPASRPVPYGASVVIRAGFGLPQPVTRS